MRIGFINYLNDYYELDIFISMISGLDNNLSQFLDLEIYTKVNPKENISEIKDKVINIKIVDSIEAFAFARVDLGIVPSLIKETISESTILFLSHDIPILCGSRGGDSALFKSGLFLYETEEEFAIKIKNLNENRDLLKEYNRNYHECTRKFLEEFF